MTTGATNFRAWLMAASCLSAITPAMAQTPPAPAASTTATPAPAAAPAADAPPPGIWINGIHLSAQIEGGFTLNPAQPKMDVGQSFTDRPNTAMLNQILIGAEKKLDPKATGYDWGFKFSGLYGADAKYTHYLGLLDKALPINQRYQLDIVEASGSLHVPVPVFEGGLDLKAGLYPTPLGAETIDPSPNAFYSHSYIFNASPYKHTGVLSITHATSLIDVYGGVDTGVNTTFGPWGDNNGAVGGIVGFGLNMMDGNLTALVLTHLGPENPTRSLSQLVPPANANGYWRFYNDIVVIWKASEKLTLTGETIFIRDGFGTSGYNGTPAAANGYGLATYAGYALTDTITLNGRAEIFRDDNGFYVAVNPGNYDPVWAQQGVKGTYYSPPAATYGALTLGLTYKPELPAPITGLAIRPEIRYDQSLGGNNVFKPTINSAGQHVFSNSAAFTFATDFVLTF